MKTIAIIAGMIAVAASAETFDAWLARQDDKDILRGRARYDREQFEAAHDAVVVTNTVVVTNAPALPTSLTDGYLATLNALGVYGMDATEAAQSLQTRLATSTNDTERAQLLAGSAALINYRLEIVRRGFDPDNIGPALGGVVTQRVLTTVYVLKGTAP